MISRISFNINMSINNIRLTCNDPDDNKWRPRRRASERKSGCGSARSSKACAHLRVAGQQKNLMIN